MFSIHTKRKVNVRLKIAQRTKVGALSLVLEKNKDQVKIYIW